MIGGGALQAGLEIMVCTLRSAHPDGLGTHRDQIKYAPAAQFFKMFSQAAINKNITFCQLLFESHKSYEYILPVLLQGKRSIL